MRDYKEGRNFILGTTFWKCLVKCTTKTELCNCKSYIKKALEYSCKNLYTNSYCLNEAFPKGSSWNKIFPLFLIFHLPFARSSIVVRSKAASFSIKIILFETKNVPFSNYFVTILSKTFFLTIEN